MKVKHLIRELLKTNEEYEVITEGCDCNGNSFKLEIDTVDKIVCINRSDHSVYADIYLNNEIWFRGKTKPPA